jgi:uncharacterized Fe-S center protein
VIRPILASDDFVAIAQASVDILRKSNPLTSPPPKTRSSPRAAISSARSIPRPLKVPIDASERLGLGTKNYELVTIGLEC